MLQFMLLFSKVRVIYGIASDMEVCFKLVDIFYKNKINKLMRSWRKFLKFMTLNLADHVVYQTNDQKQMAVSTRWRQAQDVVIPNVFEKPANVSFVYDGYCLWVGKLTGQKGERELLELAQRTPEITYRIAGHSSPDFEAGDVYKKIVETRNIELLGRLGHGDLALQYQKAAFIVHTSPVEGLSNVFLEAWGWGKPVASLYVNPDNVLESQTVGYCAAGNIPRLAGHLKSKCADQAYLEGAYLKNKEYVERQHGMVFFTEQWNSFLKKYAER